MSDREFWLAIRRLLLSAAALIEKRYGGNGKVKATDGRVVYRVE